MERKDIPAAVPLAAGGHLRKRRGLGKRPARRGKAGRGLWPLRGTLGDEETLLEALRHFASMQEIAATVFAYARMRRDEDNRVAANQALTARAQALITKVETAASFLTPELLSLPAEYIAAACEKPAFSNSPSCCARWNGSGRTRSPKPKSAS